MKTILYQGRPAESDKWLALPDGLAATYKDMGYGLRELVLRDDAESAQIEQFNAGIEAAAQLVEAKHPELAKMIRALEKWL